MTNRAGERPYASPADFATALADFCAGDARVEPYRAYRAPDLETGAAHMLGLQRLLFDEGWSRAGWPESSGGLGGDPRFRAALFETLTNHDIALPEGFLTLEILAPVLLVHAPDLARVFLPRLLAGEENWCQAFSEPDAGSDLASLRTRMEPDGDGWRLTGQKIWSSFGHLSQRSVLMARSGGPGHRGISMVLLDLDQPGVDVRPIRTEDGENHLAEIFLDGAHVAGDGVIGQLGEGWAIAMYMLQWERAAWGWQQQGKFHHRLETTLRDTRVTTVDLAGLGRTYVAQAALRARTRQSVNRLAREESLGADTSIDKLLLVEAELATWNTVRHLRRPGIELGDDDDHWWRGEFFYSRAAPIYGGSQEIQRTLVAQRVLGMERSA